MISAHASQCQPFLWQPDLKVISPQASSTCTYLKHNVNIMWTLVVAFTPSSVSWLKVVEPAWLPAPLPAAVPTGCHHEHIVLLFTDAGPFLSPHCSSPDCFSCLFIVLLSQQPHCLELSIWLLETLGPSRGSVSKLSEGSTPASVLWVCPFPWSSSTVETLCPARPPYSLIYIAPPTSHSLPTGLYSPEVQTGLAFCFVSIQMSPPQREIIFENLK